MTDLNHVSEEAMLLEGWGADEEARPKVGSHGRRGSQRHSRRSLQFMDAKDGCIHRKLSALRPVFFLVAFGGLALLGGCSILSVISLQRGTPSRSVESAAISLDEDVGCHTAQFGEFCFHETRWAITDGIYGHPDWYDNLTKSSSFEKFQAHLHAENSSLCPKPCPEGPTPVDLHLATPPPHPVAPVHPAAPVIPTPAPTKVCTATPKCYPPEEPGDDCECHMPRGPKRMTFYMYRAQDKHNFDVENVNTADLAGVLWYLHREVVASIPRKFFIQRIIRYKVTMKNTQALYDKYPKQFGPFVAYDSGSALGRNDIWNEYGFVVGCQTVDPHLFNYRPSRDVSPACFPRHSPVCNSPTWYSLPGPCPDGKYKSSWEHSANTKSTACIRDYPGGRCPSAVVTGERNCTYWTEFAGEISIDELEGIDDYDTWWVGHNDKGGTVPNGNMEYNYTSDKGVNMSFWDGRLDEDRCTERMHAVTRLFEQKYPDLPGTLPQPWCN